MSIPHVTQQQIDAMNKAATEKYGIQEEQNIEQVEQEIEVEPAYEQDIQEEVEEEQIVQPVVKKSKEDNFRILRERAERAEREREEALQYIRSLQQASTQPKQAQPQEEDFDLHIDDEALVEGKQLKQMAAEIKNLKKAVRQYEEKSSKSSQQTLELRLRNQFPDFDQVVTHDNLVQLREINPDLADTILKNEDQFKQAKLAYEMVKQLGIYRGQEFEEDRRLAQKNIAKPKTLTSLAPTKSENPLSRANAFANAPLTKEVKANLYQEMLQAMKGI